MGMMGLPSLEARMSAQERLLTLLHARFEELSQEMTDNLRRIGDSQFAAEWKIDTHFDTVEAHVEEIWQDMDASFQKLAEYQTRIERKIDSRFDKVDSQFEQVNVRFDKADAQFKQVDTHFDKAEARIEALAQDMATSFKQMADHQFQTEQKIEARFEQVDARLDKMDARFDQMDARLDNIEANMATKSDLAGMENRILDAVKQLIDSRLPPLSVSK